MRALIRPLFACSAWAQQATLEVSTTGELAVLVSDRLFGVRSVSHWGGGDVKVDERLEQRLYLKSPPPQWLTEPTPNRQSESRAAPTPVVSANSVTV